MGNIDSIHKTNEHISEEKSLIIQSIILILGMLFVCLILIAYGIFLKKCGYADEKLETSDIKVACTAISKGVFPWNIPSDDDDATDVLNSGVSVNDAHASLSVNTSVVETAPIHAQPEEMIPEQRNEIIHNYGNDADIKYDGDESVGNFVTVDQTFFDDAVFIGDSRTVGIFDYCGIDNATFLGKEGMTIYNLLECDISTNDDYDNVEEALGDQSYGKIFLMVGINEVGTADSEYFVTHYLEQIQAIEAIQPDAIIVVQSILHVCDSFDKTSDYIKNEEINRRNDALRQMCHEYGYTYLDANCVFDDERGALNEEYSFDGCHLYAQYYIQWYEFYMNHGIPL